MHIIFVIATVLFQHILNWPGRQCFRNQYFVMPVVYILHPNNNSNIAFVMSDKQECFITYKTRSAAECFTSVKVRIASMAELKKRSILCTSCQFVCEI